MKRAFKLLTFLFLCAFSTVQAQNFFEWIEPSQTYIKISVVRNGVYRIEANRLLAPNNAVPAGLNTNQFHLYYRGQETPLYVSKLGATDVFENEDYIEFYGERNDADIDTLMYRDPVTGMPAPQGVPNESRSFYTDTSAYFLTWNNTPRADEFSYIDYNSDNFDATPQASFFYQNSRTDLFNSYSNGGGVYDPFRDQNTDFVIGEGYLGSVFGTTAFTVNVKTPHPYTADAGQAVVTARVMGWSNVPNHKLLVTVGNNSQQFTYSGITMQTLSFPANVLDLTPGTQGSNVKFTASGDNPDNNRVAYVNIRYKRRFLFDNDLFAPMEYENTQNADVAIDIQGFETNGSNEAYVYDLTNRRRIRCRMSLGGVQAVLPKFGGTARLWATTSLGMAFISDTALKISKPAFSKLYEAGSGAEFVIIAPRYLKESANEYAKYRATNNYNRLSARVYYVDEIYDEFGYGSITPQAIKNFVRTALNRWNVKPKYVFLWGKARIQTRTDNGTTYRGLFCVPTWGNPETDYEYVSNFEPSQRNLVPVIPIGRVNVLNNEMGLGYLEKVREYESRPFEAWMKEMVHLGGGNDAPRQNQVQNILDDICRPIYEGQPLLGHVTYAQRRNTGVIDAANALVKARIDSGAVGISIIGDGTPFMADVELLPPDEYIGFGKYPFIHSQGCFKGAFGENINTTGEKWTLEPRRGAIGWLSASGAGFADPIGRYMKAYYEVAFRDSIGRAIGDVIKEMMRRVLADAGPASSVVNICRQSNLQGDPSLKLTIPDKPDILVEERGVAFDPDYVNAQTDSFDVNITIKNIGIAFADSFNLRLRHTTPANEKKEYIQRVPAVAIADTFAFRLPTNGNQISGRNVFEIYADFDDKINEMEDVTNNQVVLERIFNANSPAIIYPWDFAVIDSQKISLVASTYGVTNNNNIRYEFEIDSTYEFNSPLRASGIVTGTSVEGRWLIPFSLKASSFTNSTPYYWRVRLPDESNPQWVRASFKYQPSSNPPNKEEGWAQTRPPQFFEDPTVNITMNRQKRLWEFEPLKASLVAQASMSTFATRLYVNGAQKHLLTDIQTGFVYGILYCIIDGKTLELKTYETELGNVSWIRIPSMLPTFINVIESMKSGDYLLMLGNKADVGAWTPEFFTALQKVGVSNAVKNSGYDDFIILGRKGDAPGTAQQVLTPNIGSGMIMSTQLYSRLGSGEVATRTIGPALSWNDYYWDWRSLETANTDELYTSVTGVTFDGTETPLFTNATPKTHIDIGTNTSPTFIDAKKYPLLKLKAFARDSVLRTAPQLDNWHVLYAPTPEACIDPFIDYLFDKDVVYEGEMVKVRVHARNLTNIDMDSLLVRYELRTANGVTLLLKQERKAPLLGMKNYPLELTFNTTGFAGENALIITINPNYDQPERYLFNNVYVKTFRVNADERNPLLDVTFDGKRIVDGDIVSPQPEIRILLNDENQFAAIDDPTKIKVYFKNLTLNPDPISANLEPLAGGKLEFIPATLPENKAQMIFRPGKDQKLEDGEYVLEVQGEDMKFNQSGPDVVNQNPKGKVYRIRFQVINESTVTNILNYPNPFSTCTRFVYTLTGAEIPEMFQIHIFTITGKFVKSIDLKAMGEVFIGQNITSYCWDGTDEHGDRLANGVYLYKTAIRLPGETTLKKNDAQTAKYFKHGWGKMYIMR